MDGDTSGRSVDDVSVVGGGRGVGALRVCCWAGDWRDISGWRV